MATWHSFTDANTYPRQGRGAATSLRTVGRDPATIERSSGVQGKDAEGLTANAEALAQLGVTLMTVGCDGPRRDLSQAGH